MIEPFSEVHSDTPAALAPCKRTPSTLTIEAEHDRERAGAICMRLANTREAERPARSRAGHGGESGYPGEEQEGEAADHQRDRQVVQAAHDAEGDLRDLAALVPADQAGDGELRRRRPAWPMLKTRPP